MAHKPIRLQVERPDVYAAVGCCNCCWTCVFYGGAYSLRKQLLYREAAHLRHLVERADLQSSPRHLHSANRLANPACEHSTTGGRVAHLRQALDSGTRVVERVGGAQLLPKAVLHTRQLQHHAHRATRNHTRTCRQSPLFPSQPPRFPAFPLTEHGADGINSARCRCTSETYPQRRGAASPRRHPRASLRGAPACAPWWTT